jgi:predicted nuclease of predicted toxin-antitoxin system
MRFLVDAQLPQALARWIAANGHEAQHVSDLGLEGASDRTIWDKAGSLGAGIVSKDQDFVHLANSGPGPCIVWVTSGNTRRRELISRMEKIFPQIEEALESGERIVEVQ